MVGEYRFLGLYTHEAYHESIARIPVLRRKLAEVLERSGATPDSHDGKDLTEILEAYPREELFQISADELTPIALGVLHLRDRPRTRLFLRKDVYGRFMSCMVYLPRDRYTTAVRLRTQEILRAALNGETVEYSATVGDSPLARLLWWCGPSRGPRWPTWTPATWKPRSSPRHGRGTRTCSPRPRAGWVTPRRAPLLAPVRGRDPGDVQDRRARRRTR